MRNGPIPLNTHAAIDPFAAVLLIAAPWIFGFSEVDEATALCVVGGAVMLIGAATTDWRLSLVRLLPLSMHFMVDLLLGALLILWPFVFGFSDKGAATRFMIIYGALLLLTALGTRWDPAEAGEPREPPHRAPPPANP
jgi:hypothetical protein